MRKRIFSVISKLAFGVYSRAPIFGVLRASVGVVSKGDLFLVIDRSDGRGYSFPGGFALPWENNQQALIREVREETGLHVTHSQFLAAYLSDVVVPCNINVFRIEVSGRLRDSWEGTPEWVGLRKLRDQVADSQKYIVERLLPLLNEGATPGHVPCDLRRDAIPAKSEERQ